jgi:hypothetical protein
LKLTGAKGVLTLKIEKAGDKNLTIKDKFLPLNNKTKEGNVMRTILKKSVLKLVMVSAFVLAGAAITADSYAATASSNATATVVTPIAISNTQALAFGSFSTSATGQTVTISAGGARSSVGAIVVPASAATAASFNVTGSGVLTYAITLPASTTITNGTDTFTVNAFTSNPSGTGALTAGAQTLTVGATVTTAGTLSTGNYLGSFNVSVDYN